MRVNVYHEELTEEVEVVPVEPRPGVRYIGLRFILASAPELHDRPDDDDRSAVTLWCGTPAEGRRLLEGALDELEEWERRDWLSKEPPRRCGGDPTNAVAMASVPPERRRG